MINKKFKPGETVYYRDDEGKPCFGTVVSNERAEISEKSGFYKKTTKLHVWCFFHHSEGFPPTVGWMSASDLRRVKFSRRGYIIFPKIK